MQQHRCRRHPQALLGLMQVISWKLMVSPATLMFPSYGGKKCQRKG
jgi:hypothetical protein